MSKAKIDWQFYPKSEVLPAELATVISVFVKNIDKITTDSNHFLSSNDVLKLLTDDLVKVGFTVEHGKKAGQKLEIPVLFGRNGDPEKTFHVDAYNGRVILEVEAGRAVANNQFLKDYFEALAITWVDYLIIAVRKTYRNGHDFNTIVRFFDVVYSSPRFEKLLGLLIIGY